MKNALRRDKGYQELWGWWGLSYSTFLVLPRVLMHEMPDEWQGKMAGLLKEFNDAFPGADHQSRPMLVGKDNKLTKWPGWILNYRYPDQSEIEKLRVS